MIKKIIHNIIRKMSFENVIRIHKSIPDNAKIKNISLNYDIEVEVDGKVLSSDGIIKRKYHKHERLDIPINRVELFDTKPLKKKAKKKNKVSPQRVRGEYSLCSADITAVRRMLHKFDKLGALTPLMKEELKRVYGIHIQHISKEDRKCLLRMFYQSREKFLEKGGDDALKQYYIDKKKQNNMFV